MAVKFKSKYTAQRIEELLDLVGSTVAGALIRVEELPSLEDALTASFYEYNGKIYYVENNQWVELGANNVGGGMPVNPDEGVIGGDIVVEPEVEGEEPIEVKAVICFEDFEQYEDDLHFTIKTNSDTDKYIHALKSLMESEGKTYYAIAKTEAYGFIEDQPENNLLGATAASNHGHFFIKMDLIDGHEVDITLEEVLDDGTELYLVEYVGYAL
jgi:hypothetical protein